MSALSKESKAVLALLISQIQRILGPEDECPYCRDINKLLENWIIANDLEPEQVKHWEDIKWVG